jgi:hypothetical protein
MLIENCLVQSVARCTHEALCGYVSDCVERHPVWLTAGINC